MALRGQLLFYSPRDNNNINTTDKGGLQQLAIESFQSLSLL